MVSMYRLQLFNPCLPHSQLSTPLCPDASFLVLSDVLVIVEYNNLKQMTEVYL